MCTASPYEYSERGVIFRDRNGGRRLTDIAGSVLNKAHTVVNPLGTCPALGAPLQMVSTKPAYSSTGGIIGSAGHTISGMASSSDDVLRDHIDYAEFRRRGRPVQAVASAL